MNTDLSYINRESLPQFSNFDYSKEYSMIPELESDYNPEDIKNVLGEEGAVLVQDAEEI